MKPRLLIVDDEKTILFAMQDYFAAFGFEADCARDKQAALKLLAQHSYAVLITDLRLAGSDDTHGLDIARYAFEGHPSMRCILLTAHGSPGLEAASYERGVDLFLSKPKPLREIADRVRMLLEAPPARRRDLPMSIPET